MPGKDLKADAEHAWSELSEALKRVAMRLEDGAGRVGRGCTERLLAAAARPSARCSSTLQVLCETS